LFIGKSLNHWSLVTGTGSFQQTSLTLLPEVVNGTFPDIACL